MQIRIVVSFLLLFFPAAFACAQDRQWLRDWENAQRARPEQISAIGRIAPANEEGTPLVVHGRLFAADGRTPLPNVVVFAYQTDRMGAYNVRGASGWRLRGWAKTDARGRFEFRTIRPGSYPEGGNPSHIHFTIEGPGALRQWTEEINFAGDPHLKADHVRRSAADGRFGSIRPVTVRDGVAHVEFNIRENSKGRF
jgi:protocatechuate 3,4-dioxygenase, beta subunit